MLCSLMLTQNFKLAVSEFGGLVSVHLEFCTFCVAWCSHERQKKPSRSLFFFPLMPLDYSSQPRVVLLSVAVSCLQLKCRDCHKNPHICYQSLVAFSQLFSVLSSIYKVTSMRGRPWINIALAINSRSCTILFLPIKHKLCTEPSLSFRFCDWDFCVWSAFLLPDQENIYITEPRVIQLYFAVNVLCWHR